MYQFTWERVKSHKHVPDKECGHMADGTKFGFCRHCNYICFWR